jgi:hypothetical protein
MAKTNSEMLQAFMSEVKAGPSTKKDYVAKLTKLSKQVTFADPEGQLVDFLKTVENPNTRTNKAFSLIRLRRHFGMPVVLLEGLRDETKGEIRIHRKQKSKDNFESLVSYAEMLEELETLSGRTYVMNYLWIKHGLRNKDINVVFKSRKPAEVTENTVVFNPKAKKPKVAYYIVDYKTAGVYGDKAITITDRRFFDELRGLGLKNNQYLYATQSGAKASVNYMNVLASKHSINQYGEGRICKILVRHLLDTKQYDLIEKISKQRGTALSTLYTSYNLFDNK